MHCYIIPPTSNLELMNLGDRFFCLAQLYAKPENFAYRRFFLDKVSEGKWVTLDNGAGDHDIINESMLIQITQELQPSEVIPPDILFDGIKTIRNLESFINQMSAHGLLGKVQILGCPQGKNREEWLFAYNYMLQHPNVNTIGMSKIAIPKAFLNSSNDTNIMEARHMCIDYLEANNLLSKPLHFLGMGNPMEFFYYNKIKQARSTDSCNTVWSGMNDIIFHNRQFERIPTPKDYFDRMITEEQWENAADNVRWFKGLLINVAMNQLSRLDN